jgi:hypothetical protein
MYRFLPAAIRKTGVAKSVVRAALLEGGATRKNRKLKARTSHSR